MIATRSRDVLRARFKQYGIVSVHINVHGEKDSCAYDVCVTTGRLPQDWAYLMSHVKMELRSDTAAWMNKKMAKAKRPASGFRVKWNIATDTMEAFFHPRKEGRTQMLTYLDEFLKGETHGDENTT